MPMHEVSQGECVLSLATEHGLFWETVWNHPENSDLKQLREDPNVLHEGDQIFLPDLTIKEEDCATEQHHKFKRKGVPGVLRVKVMIDNQPIANASYVLIIDGNSKNGTTDGQGMIVQPIPADAIQGELRVTKDGHQRRFYLNLGHLSPINTDQGVNQRLRQLGYFSNGDPAGAVSKFQEDQGLTVNGTVDDELRQKLEEVYGQ